MAGTRVVSPIYTVHFGGAWSDLVDSEADEAWFLCGHLLWINFVVLFLVL